MRFLRFARPLSRIFGGEARSERPQTDPIPAPDAASPQRLAAIAASDGEHDARADAIGQLEDGGTLRRLAGLGSAPPDAGAPSGVPISLEHVAQQRLAQLGLLEQAVASIDAPGRLAALAVEGGSSRLRQLAAQRISDPDELRGLLRRLRGKDKSVYKIVRQKCDVLRAEEQRVVQIRNDCVAACESLERHSHRVYDVIYEASFRNFHSRWQALEAHAPPEIQRRAAHAVGRCREIISDHLREVEQRASEELDRAARDAARERAAALAELESRNRSEAAALAATEAAARIEADEARRAEESATEAAALRQVGGLIGKVHDALREGNTGRASGLRRALEEKLSTLPLIPPHLGRQVAKLDGTLDELKQWKEHAAAPKRAELIGEMEALIGSPEPPEALAKRIKQLQDDWKTVSKGIVIDSEADWQRFHQASLAAYQPCREYFEARAKLREANLEQLRGVLERLRAFEAAQGGDTPDWRTIGAVLREAPQEWRRHSLVERGAGRALQKEFDAAMGRLRAKLDAWHIENAQAKRSLIQQAQQIKQAQAAGAQTVGAQAVGVQADRREAVDALRRLQLQWKDVGTARRDQEQALWTAFRAECDAIYQMREQAYAEHAAALETGKLRAAELCEAVERAAALSGTELLEASAAVPQWRSAFEGVGELPGGGRRSLEDRFERAIRRVQAAVSQWRSGEKHRSIAGLLEAACHIQAYGWAVAQAAPAPERLALLQAAEVFIAGIAQWPKGGAEAACAALAAAGTASPTDAALHVTALRMLCIRSEILAGRPTPAEDLELRRSYQMERLLVQRMGHGSDAGADGADALALEWVRVGPVAAQTHEALLARFIDSVNSVMRSGRESSQG